MTDSNDPAATMPETTRATHLARAAELQAYLDGLVTNSERLHTRIRQAYGSNAEHKDAYEGSVNAVIRYCERAATLRWLIAREQERSDG